MQVVIPLVMTVGLLGSFGGYPETLRKDSGWIFGKIPAGTPTYIQNAGFAWVLSLVPLSVLAWFGMNNLKTISPDTGNPIVAFAKITYLYTLAFVPSIFSSTCTCRRRPGWGCSICGWRFRSIIILALLVMKLAAFGPMKGKAWPSSSTSSVTSTPGR